MLFKILRSPPHLLTSSSSSSILASSSIPVTLAAAKSKVRGPATFSPPRNRLTAALACWDSPTILRAPSSCLRLIVIGVRRNLPILLERREAEFNADRLAIFLKELEGRRREVWEQNARKLGYWRELQFDCTGSACAEEDEHLNSLNGRHFCRVESYGFDLKTFKLHSETKARLRLSPRC